MHERLHHDIAWLHGLLDEVAPPTAAEQAARDAAAALIADADALAPRLAAIPVDDLKMILKRLTIRFHLRNKAEQVHIARINRQREHSATPDNPRPESIAEAITAMARAGVPADRALAIIQRLDIQPTLTAHPTEARRRSILQKQWSIGDCLERIDGERPTPTERRMVESRVRQTLALLLATDEVRTQRLHVLDEVRNGLVHLTGVIWETVPAIHRDLADAFHNAYGTRPDLPAFLRYRSWIGGDRDGNPKVTAEITRTALDMLRSAATDLWITAIDALRQDLSVSTLRVPILPELTADLEREAASTPLPPEAFATIRNEPLRQKLMHMRARLVNRATSTYTTATLTADLDLLHRALHHAGLGEVADGGRLADMRTQARAFGLFLAAIDIRQHSGVHEDAVAELLRAGGVAPDYAGLPEAKRIALLTEELRTDRPLMSRAAPVSAQTRELLDVLTLAADIRRTEPGAVGAYIVSMTHGVSDMLEVLVLLREVGAWRHAAGAVESDIDITPLFETVADLEQSAALLEALFKIPAYADHLRARGGFQEIMLGYSDSNKDGGYWMANWRLYRAQRDIARTCRAAGVDLRFFHGRGGSVARGGGRAHRAILASPPEARTGRIRFTEQGEVITFRYAMPALARRHLEQIVNAALSAAARADESPPVDTDHVAALMDDLGAASMRAYRSLIDAPGFWQWFTTDSPVRHIGNLPIASRPVSRSSGELLFANLRAIPWVFSWTQMRFNVPGWFGIGAAFQSHVLSTPERLSACRAAYAAGGYFRVLIDNAQQEMARARLPIARWYAGGDAGPLMQTVRAEFDTARSAILAITGQSELLDNNRVIQDSIRQRNPDTDVINTLQLELLRRTKADLDPDVTQLILLSVNGLAAAMHSTG